MMLGELNASHTGISAGGGFGGQGRGQAPFPGLDLQPDKSGFYRVAHVYKHGPADKDYVKISKGDYILAIDERDIASGDNYWKHLAKASGGRLTLLVNSKPQRQ